MSKQDKQITLYWSIVPFGDSHMHIAATEQGLVYVGSLGGSFEEIVSGAARRRGIVEWVRDDARLEPYGKELAEYGAGTRSTFEGNFDLRGTPFQLEVWGALQRIPFGRTCTYSDIAEAIGSPSAVRAVGSAIGANPILIMVPCHRVIGKNGSLTGFRGGLPMKQLLLQLEQNGTSAGASEGENSERGSRNAEAPAGSFESIGNASVAGQAANKPSRAEETSWR